MSRKLIVTFILAAWASGWTTPTITLAQTCSGGGFGEVLWGGCNEQPTPRDRDSNPPPQRGLGGGSGEAPRCNWVYDWTFDPNEPGADTSINLSGRRQHFFWPAPGNPADCGSHLWTDASNDPAAPPVIRAADLLPGVWLNVQRQLPTPIPRVAPADFDRDGFAYVQVHTFFWVDQEAGQWAPVSGSASGGGITVSVQAVPVRLVVSTGDGQEVVCEGAPPPFRQGAGSNPVDFPGCGYIYRDSSAMAANGETFPLTLTVVWSASWSATTGEGGDLGARTTTSDTRWLPVAEIQAITTSN